MDTRLPAIYKFPDSHDSQPQHTVACCRARVAESVTPFGFPVGEDLAWLQSDALCANVFVQCTLNLSRGSDDYLPHLIRFTDGIRNRVILISRAVNVMSLLGAYLFLNVSKPCNLTSIKSYLRP